MVAERTVLDQEFLKNFIRDHIEEFRDGLAKIRKDDPVAGKAVTYIAEGDLSVDELVSTKPLVLGLMASGASDLVGAGALNQRIQSAASEIDRVLEEQEVLFEDIEDALWATIEELKKNQDANLESITPEEFTDIFEDVESDLAGGEDD